MLTVLAGGVGAARFLRGLTRIVPPDEVVAIVNVGDDLTRFGLRVCPDLDSVTYWLGGVVHPEQQWGRADESHVVAGELARFGHDDWFTLGDRDLGVHLHRSMRLAEGAPLSQVAAEVAAAFGVEVRLLPATDDVAETRIAHGGRPRPALPGVLGPGARRTRGRCRPLRGCGRGACPRRASSRPSSTRTRCWSPRPTRWCRSTRSWPSRACSPRCTPRPRRWSGSPPSSAARSSAAWPHRLLPAVGAEVSALGVARYHGARGRRRRTLDGWVVDTRDADQLDERPRARAGGRGDGLDDGRSRGGGRARPHVPRPGCRHRGGAVTGGPDTRGDAPTRTPRVEVVALPTRPALRSRRRPGRGAARRPRTRRVCRWSTATSCASPPRS